MSEKMDFMDFQRKFQEQYGVLDQDVERLRKTLILTFWTSDDGRIMSRLPSGGVVFRHKEGGMQIGPGETWVCEVIERNTTSFAIGMQRLDAKFFFDLRSDQIDRLAEVVWENNKGLLEPRFESQFLKRMQEMVDQKVQESTRKEEEANARVEELRKELESVRMADQMVRSSLERELQEAKNRQSEEVKAVDGSPLDPDIRSFVPAHPKVRRIGPDEIFSEELGHRHYFVHLSSDQSIMTIRPHDRGNVTCVDHKIKLNGLGMISPYGGPTDMPAEYSPKYGGIVVLIKYQPSGQKVPGL